MYLLRFIIKQSTFVQLCHFENFILIYTSLALSHNLHGSIFALIIEIVTLHDTGLITVKKSPNHTKSDEVIKKVILFIRSN